VDSKEMSKKDSKDKPAPSEKQSNKISDDVTDTVINADDDSNRGENSNANKKIFAALVKRDSKEKHVTVCKLIESNDALVKMVSTLKIELDEQVNRLETSLSKEKYLQRRIIELETLLREKDRIILTLQRKSGK
jgi:hypothetical protein